MNALEMDPQIRARWVAALRSGEYEQGNGKLRQDGKFCCLGVLCDLAAAEKATEAAESKVEPGLWTYDSDANYLPPEVQGWAGLNSHNPPVDAGPVGRLNDYGWTFAQIADAIEGVTRP